MYLAVFTFRYWAGGIAEAKLLELNSTTSCDNTKHKTQQNKTSDKCNLLTPIGSKSSLLLWMETNILWISQGGASRLEKYVHSAQSQTYRMYIFSSVCIGLYISLVIFWFYMHLFCCMFISYIPMQALNNPRNSTSTSNNPCIYIFMYIYYLFANMCVIENI